MPAVAIVVVSWNTRDLLAKALDSMKPEVDAGRATVVVIDNASSDGSAELVSQRYGWATLGRSARNLGFGAAVNAGARAALATGEPEWIAPANADIELQPGAVEELLAAGRDDSRAGALAPRLVHPDGSTQHSVHPFPSVGLMLQFNLGRQLRDRAWAQDNCLEGFWDPAQGRRVPWAVGAFELIRRQAWEQLSGFDERRFIYAEDLDLGWRLHQRGWATRYVPEARVIHHEAAATRQAYGAQTTARWQAATYEWIAATHGARRVRAIAAINTVGAGARALRRSLPPAERAEYRKWARTHAAGLRRRYP
jgi:GT2 family glycosyltransferase